MINRRGALRSFLGMPFYTAASLKAASEIAEAAPVNQVASGMCTQSNTVSASAADPLQRFFQKRLGKMSPFGGPSSHMPASISTKKSWSEGFKEHVQMKREEEYRHFDGLMEDAFYGDDPLKKVQALASLIERFGAPDSE